MPTPTLESTALLLSRATVAGKYLAIVLASESYGISVLKVREIIRMQKITPLPQMPDFVRGVINLRGRVIPIVDLRVKFELPAEFKERTCIVVVQIKVSDHQVAQIGLIVDMVEEVIILKEEMIEAPPDFCTHMKTEFILGMAKVKGEVKTLLDIDRVIATETMQALARC